MKWAEHTYKCLKVMHTKFSAHLAVFSLSVCTAHQISTPVTIRCASTTIHQVAACHSCMSLQTLTAEETEIMFSYFAFGCIYIECACLLIGLYHIVEYYKLYECIWCKYLVCTVFTAVSEAHSGE